MGWRWLVGLCILLLAIQLLGARGPRRKPEREKQRKPSSQSRSRLCPIRPTLNFGAGARWQQVLASIRIEYRRLLKTVSFIVITCAALVNCVAALIFSARQGFGLTTRPVTYALLQDHRRNPLHVPDRADHVLCRRAGVGGAGRAEPPK